MYPSVELLATISFRNGYGCKRVSAVTAIAAGETTQKYQRQFNVVTVTGVPGLPCSWITYEPPPSAPILLNLVYVCARR